MKAILINPPEARGVKMVREGRCMQREGAWTSIWPPLSLAICASMLESLGVKVALHDCIVEEIDIPKLKTMAEGFKPDLAVINTATPSIEGDLAVSKLIKEVNPAATVIGIGIHVSALPEECLQLEPALDIIVRGEPEFAVRDVARAVQSSANLAEIDGISYRKGEHVVHNKNRVPAPSLDELPFPAWHLVATTRYLMPFTTRPFLLVVTGRGCPYHCVFCAAKAYYGSRLRLRSPKLVVDELQWAKSELGVSDFLFWAESFTMNREYALAVCDEILTRGLKIRWVCNSRVDHVDYEMLKKFREAGCWMIGYGIECGTQRVLDDMKKGTTLEQAREAAKAAKRAGLEVTGHFVLGFPGETQSEIWQTIRFAKELDFDYAQFYCTVPFPGSELYELARKRGWMNTRDWARFEQNYSVLDLPKMSAAQVMTLRRQAFRKFYVRPRMVAKTLMKVRSPTEFVNFLRMVRDFVTWV